MTHWPGVKVLITLLEDWATPGAKECSDHRISSFMDGLRLWARDFRTGT